MFSLLLTVLYLSFISMGLPDSLLGAAWPSMYPQLHVPVSFAGILSLMISGGTVLSSLLAGRLLQ
nr:MFS transporter [Oscillospiraceae bacterium]